MKMLIDSKWVDAVSGKTRDILAPADGTRIDSVPEGATADAEKAIEAAVAAKRRMRAFPAHARARVLTDVAARMEREREELAPLLARENGKPLNQTREEISAAARIFRGFGEEAKRLFGRTSPLDNVPGMENHFAMTIREPVGVVAAIVPFNYPVELYAHKAAAAIAGGNATVVKPPNDCPLTLLKIAQMIEEAGLPRGGHQMITGAGSAIGTVLADSDHVDLITLTGSTRVGQDISKRASQSLKKVLLELGGNDPCIIFEDADLDRAAEAVIAGRLARGNGQICCAVKRVYAHELIAERFAETLAKKTRELKVGDPLLEETDVGPLITEEAAKTVEAAIQDAVTRGATVRAGGTRSGTFIDPTVITGVAADSLVLTEETFGPVIPIVPFETVDEAIEMANDSPYGLQGAVFTNDISTAMNVAHRLECGGVIVNWSSAVRVENLPFGGRKLTGRGAESIHDTLLEMTEVKTVILHDALATYNASRRE